MSGPLLSGRGIGGYCFGSGIQNGWANQELNIITVYRPIGRLESVKITEMGG